MAPHWALLTLFSLFSLSCYATASAYPSKGAPVLACNNIPAPKLPGVNIAQFHAQERLKISTITGNADGLSIVENLDVCEVNATLTHPGADNRVAVSVWLPLRGWNGRFQGIGGAGWVAGSIQPFSMAWPASQGFAVGVTDGGNISSDNINLNPKILQNGQVDYDMLATFASRALHEMTVVGKAITASFYGTSHFFSYWQGCSTGGRQGYMLAQKYPDDYDGILANAPAIHWPNLLLTLNWGHFLMNLKKYFPSQCEYAAFQAAAITQCDGLDGVLDGIISAPELCKFDPYRLVGTKVPCLQGQGQPAQVTLSLQGADIVAKIRQAPRSASGQQFFPGYTWGTPYSGIAKTNITGSVNVDVPDAGADGWVRYYLKKDPKFNFSSIQSIEALTDLYATAYPEYGGIIGTDNPDLSAFQLKRGKLLTWHGLSDELITPDNTLLYRRQVESVMGGAKEVNKFYRLFLAPGVGHCWEGYGPKPVNALNSLIDWVERGEGPETLFANFTNKANQTVSRNVCLYPKVSRYNGKGDINKATSYTCADKF